MSKATVMAPIILVLAACGTGNPATSPPSAAPTSAPSSSPSGPSTIVPRATVALGRLPIGRVVFDELEGSPEGDFLGAFVLRVDGVRTALQVPVTDDWFSGTWSPAGDRLLVNAFTGERLVVGILDPATGTYAAIEPDGMVGEVECSDWTPDARRVICARSGTDPETDGIYTVDIVTGAATRLTTSLFHHVIGTAGECGGGEGRAVYSPDGSRFAYIQQTCGTGANPSDGEEGAITVASADGSNSKVIVPFGGVRTHPGGEIAWSPGDVIAFGTQDGALSVINADGTSLRTIDLPVPGFAFGPAWSPDGKWLLITVVQTTTGRADLFVVAADGSTMIQLTDGAAVEGYTDWAIAH